MQGNDRRAKEDEHAGIGDGGTSMAGLKMELDRAEAKWRAESGRRAASGPGTR